ncbi:hypothetical protein MKX03_021410 [Papaver bracteatum]|nr:hypothetical protein MKX03_021410 [Papaver bracteatum]
MMASDTGVVRFMTPTDRAIYPVDISMIGYSGLSHYSHTQNFPTVYEFGPHFSCLSNTSSASDEAEELQLRVIDERKRRRMISNRESARRLASSFEIFN